MEERILQLASNDYERLDDHPNELIRKTVQYPLKKERKGRRPRDILLNDPP